MGDFEEVERLQAGIRARLLRMAKSGRDDLRGISAQAVLPWLCAAAFGPALADADGSAPGPAKMGVLISVGADALADLLEDASSRARSASQDLAPDLIRSLEGEISRAVGDVLGARGQQADELRSDIAMVMREIDAGGTVFRAAVEAGDTELEREVLTAFEALGAEFGDMAFMLADLARAAGEIQDSLGRQDAELRAAGLRTGRQSADVRMIREELAVIDQRGGQWLPEQAESSAPGPRWDGCPYRGLLPYDQAHAAVFCGRERLTAELAGKLAGTGIVMVTGASGAGKTSLLRGLGTRAGPGRAGARVGGLAGGQPYRDRTAAHRPGRGTGGAGWPGPSRRQAAAGRRAGPGPPADPGDHQGRGRRRPAGADHRPVRAGLRGRRPGRAARADRVPRRGGRGGSPPGRTAG